DRVLSHSEVDRELSKNREAEKMIEPQADFFVSAQGGSEKRDADLYAGLMGKIDKFIRYFQTTGKNRFELYLERSGKYANIKEFTRPGSFEFRNFGQNGSTMNTNMDPEGNITSYDVDPDGAGSSPTVNVGNPDFNFTSLRGNAVLRWEYRPGSTVYLVWTQNRSDYLNDGQFQFKRSFDRLVSAKADNIFMLKFTYWFNV
ncbi:MAG: putative membrane associated hydrolase, partial [Bacteroidetes bacterium]|nr:putative membrane associated hydrolase [Bacteroidota bacterium]